MFTSKLKTGLNPNCFGVWTIRPVVTNAVNATDSLKNKNLKSWRDIPGPRSFPFIGPFLSFIPGIGSVGSREGLELTDHFYKVYGPIVRLDAMFGRPPLIFLMDPEESAHVLRSENQLPIRKGFESLEYYRQTYNKTEFQGTTGLITEHGERWKSVRSKVNPAMLQPKTIKLYSTVLDEVAQDMIVRMKYLRDNNMIKDNLDTEMNKWALESIGVVALGGRIGCLDPNLPKDSPEYQLIQCVHDIFDLMQELDFKPSLWRYYATKAFKKAMNIYDQQLKLSKYFIKRAMVDIEKKQNTEDEKGVLEKLLAIDENVALVMATDMLFAGVDTTANSILATMYLLAKSPEKQDKLREELLTGDMRRPYLKACLKESMRMMPVVAGNFRQSTKDYNICGYMIPTGTNIVFAHQHMSLMEEQYPMAKEFIPERWLVDKTDPLYQGNTHPFTTNPFGFGVRSCIGKRIALLEIETLLSRIVQNFKIDWVGEPFVQKPVSINRAVGPFNFILSDV